MWRILPVAACVIYAAVPVSAMSALLAVFGMKEAVPIALYSFWTAVVAVLVMLPVAIPFSISKMFKK